MLAPARMENRIQGQRDGVVTMTLGLMIQSRIICMRYLIAFTRV
jgi:hypothetical protein